MFGCSLWNGMTGTCRGGCRQCRNKCRSVTTVDRYRRLDPVHRGWIDNDLGWFLKNHHGSCGRCDGGNWCHWR